MIEKKAKNKIRNRGTRQAEARAKLEAAGKQGPVFLAATLFTGNSYMRQVVRGAHLASGVERYGLTEAEEMALRAMREAFRYVRDVDNGKGSDPADALVVFGRAKPYLEAQEIWVPEEAVS